jgi:predicted SAM-dependent methyltransferase
MPLPAGATAINLGCGLSTAPGWINIDNSPSARLSKYPLLKLILRKLGVLSNPHYGAQWSRAIEVRDLRKPLPYDDLSIDYVYSSHFLEHLSPDDGQKLIGEVFRVLKPRGLVRIVVPDLAIGARHYVAAMDSNPNDAKAATAFINWLQLSTTGLRDPHLWMYDAPSLAAIFSECGFINTVVCEYRKGRVPDCDILDNRADESLYLEAEKP